MAKIGVDPDCVELARKFLDAAYTAEAPTEKRVAAEMQSLSEAIQTAIEDWFFSHQLPACDCGAPTDGRWGNKHSSECASVKG